MFLHVENFEVKRTVIWGCGSERISVVVHLMSSGSRINVIFEAEQNLGKC